MNGTTAGLASRSLANVIDFTLLMAVVGAAYIGYTAVRFLLRPRSFSFPAPSLALVIIVGGVVAIIYFTLCWRLSGRTYGDYVIGLRVVSHNGAHLRMVGAFTRATTCVVVPIGFVWCGIDRRRRSLQDVVLRTKVVYDWPEV